MIDSSLSIDKCNDDHGHSETIHDPNQSTNSEIIEEKWIESDGNNFSTDEDNPYIPDANEHDDENDENVNIGMLDLFADPDPYDEFSFSFMIPKNQAIVTQTKEISQLIGRDNDLNSNNAKEDGNTNDIVKIHLFGIKAENGQMLHSTGLTLWRASSLLCQFMASHPNMIRQKSVLEVSTSLYLLLYDI